MNDTSQGAYNEHLFHLEIHENLLYYYHVTPLESDQHFECGKINRFYSSSSMSNFDMCFPLSVESTLD